MKDYEEQPERGRRESRRSEAVSRERRKIPWPLRVLAWAGMLGIFFGVGYFVAGAGLRMLNNMGIGKPGNVLESPQDAQRLMESPQEEITIHRKEYRIYTLQNGTLVSSLMHIAPGVEEEDAVAVLEKVLEPLRVASGTQEPFRVLHIFRAGDMLYLDMNSAFVSALRAVGTRDAALIMTGLVRSMVDNFPPAEKIRFLVNGKLSKVTEPLDLTVPWTLAPAS